MRLQACLETAIYFLTLDSKIKNNSRLYKLLTSLIISDHSRLELLHALYEK